MYQTYKNAKQILIKMNPGTWLIRVQGWYDIRKLINKLHLQSKDEKFYDYIHSCQRW